MNPYCLPKYSYILFLLLALSNCKKIVDPGQPLNSVLPENVFSNDTLAEKNTLGIYVDIMQEFNLLNGYASKFCSLAADELELLGGTDNDKEFLLNTLTARNTTIKKIWEGGYKYVAHANNVIAGLTGSNKVTPLVKAQLLGEAYFLRSLTYFFLTNLFGDVPLVLLTDYTKNASIPRTATAEVYSHIISDLEEATQLLPVDYITKPTYRNERVRVNKMACQALLARVYLYSEQWQAAEKAASEVINNQKYHLETDLSKVFTPDSKEAILQFMPVNQPVIYNSAEAALFIPPGTKPTVYIDQTLLDVFDTDDRRKAEWLGSISFNSKTYYYPLKYKYRTSTMGTEYNTVLRMAEQYLIRAEALAQQGKITEAIKDINIIRTRAGLQDLSDAMSKENTLLAIEQERRIELFTEWGHRWFDLKRSPAHTLFMKKKINEVMSTKKPQTWDVDDALWPLPSDQIILNPKLVQNHGY